MKTKKIVALTLSLAMVLGVVSACGDDTATTDAATTDAAAAATEAAADETEAAAETDAAADETEAATAEDAESEFTELAVADVTDEGDQLMIYGWNEEFPGLVDSYSDIEYELETTESDTYQTKLDEVLASGDNAPDLFVCDADYAKKYMDSDNTLPINDLGIAYSELTEMYNYTLQFATDGDNVIKGLAWQACPCGVFYQRTLAEEYLGVSEPDDVAPFFATWDAFLQTCRDVNEASNGEVKTISGYDDIYRAYLNTRTSAWIEDGAVNIDDNMLDYLDLATTLMDEGLTFETTQWAEAWTANQSNATVLSYWGPMWLARFSMGLDTASGGTNPTSGEWGLVSAPTPFYWGGTWMMASTYCDMKASVAQIMRDIAIDTDNLQAMADGGEFVNNVSIMTDIAADDSFACDYLGGQNPAAVLLDSASTIDNSLVSKYDKDINDLFSSAVNSYLASEDRDWATEQASFVAGVEDLGIV